MVQKKDQPKDRKSVKLWIWLIALPFIIMAVTALLQFVLRFALSSTIEPGSAIRIIFNIFSILAGLAGTFGILLIPVWIIFLVRDLKANKA